MKCPSLVFILIPLTGGFPLRFTSSFMRRVVPLDEADSSIRTTATVLSNEREKETNELAMKELVDGRKPNSVCFVGETSFRAEPVAMAPTAQHLHDFFFRDENWNTIISDRRGGVRMVQSDDQGLIEIETSVVSTKGLRVSSICVLKAQLSNQIDIQSLPTCTFDLVDSRLSATGAAPLVWLFNQIVSQSDLGTKGGTNFCTSSTTRVTCEQKSQDLLVFVGDARIEVNIKIPERILKFVSPNDIEYQGCQAIQSLVEKELLQGMSRLRLAYLDYQHIPKN